MSGSSQVPAAGRLSLALIALGLLRPPAAAAETPFRPEECFPAESLAFLSIDSVAGLKEGLGSVPFGLIANHPAVRAALGKLPELLREKLLESSKEFEEMAGMDLLSALGLLRGELSLAVASMGPGFPPNVAMAIEMGEGREKILGLFQRLDDKLRASMGGGELPKLSAGSHQAVLWPGGDGPSFGRVVLGGHLVLAYPADLLPGIARLHDRRGPGQPAPPGAAPDRPLGEAPYFAALKPRLELTGRQLRFALNIDGLRKLARKEGGDDPDLVRFLAASGLDGLDGLGYAMGISGGDFEAHLHLATPRGPAGLIRSLAETFQRMEGIDDALGKVPAGASSLFASRLQVGKLLAGLLAVADALPDGREKSRELIAAVESKLGISVKDDVLTLPPLAVLSFSISPPAGSLFDDAVGLSRTSEFEPYRKLIDKIAARSGGLRSIEEGGKKIQYFAFGGYLPLDGGLTAWSGSVRALRRLATHYLAGPRIGDDPRLFKEVKDGLSGAEAAVVLRASRGLLATYNLAVALANLIAPSFEAYLSQVGVDPGLLPPGEEFLSALGDGSLRFTFGPDGIGVHSRRVLTNAGWTSVLVGSAIGASLLVPTLIKARGAADAVKCQMNLREIGKLCMIYADSSGARFFPRSPDGGVAALKVLADAFDEVRPTVFLCPISGEKAAERTPDGKLQIDSAHSSYELVPWKISPADTPNTILAFDRAPCHGGRRNVLFIDLSVETVEEAKFQQMLAADRARFTGPPAEKAPSEPKKGAKKVRKQK